MFPLSTMPIPGDVLGLAVLNEKASATIVLCLLEQRLDKKELKARRVCSGLLF